MDGSHHLLGVQIMKDKNQLKETLRVIDSYFTKAEKKWVLKATFSQILFAFLDLIGVALVGLLGAVAISGIESTKPGNRVSNVLSILNLNGISFQSVAIILCSSAILILITRTLVSMYATKRVLRKLSFKSAEISASVFKKVQGKNLTDIENEGFYQTQYAITSGVESLVVRVYGTVLTLVTDITLIVIMSATLVFIDPILALSTFALFGITGLVLYFSMHKSAARTGKENAEFEIRSSEIISSGLNLFREIRLRNGSDALTEKFKINRQLHSETISNLNFLPYLGKYIVEAMLILGTVFIASIQLYLHDAIHAATTISVFLAAGSRIAPSFLRLQQGFVTIRGSLGMASKTLLILADHTNDSVDEEENCIIDGWENRLTVRDLFFQYENQSDWTLSDINFEINSGELLALVGPSGSGKSTLADLVIGVIEPSRGNVTISGVSPGDATRQFPGKVAYVPQEVKIFTGSIRENLVIGLDPNSITDAKLVECLNEAGLERLFSDPRVHLDSEISEFGVQLSGGEKQRFGIARALITDPQLLILDEATSALDAETESSITSMLSRRKLKLAILVIAHRLSTVREADRVLYLSQGKIVSSGTFTEVRKNVPEFELQASLMGL